MMCSTLLVLRVDGFNHWWDTSYEKHMRNDAYSSRCFMHRHQRPNIGWRWCHNSFWGTSSLANRAYEDSFWEMQIFVSMRIILIVSQVRHLSRNSGNIWNQFSVTSVYLDEIPQMKTTRMNDTLVHFGVLVSVEFGVSRRHSGDILSIIRSRPDYSTSFLRTRYYSNRHLTTIRSQ